VEREPETATGPVERSPGPKTEETRTQGAVPARRNYGPFRIVSFIGKGGMGVVYLAEEEGLGRRVALKVLPEAADAVAIERFRREAQAAAGLTHRGIAQLHAFGEDQGTLYYAMEFVDGRSLRQAMDSERIDDARAAELGQEIAEALGCAHEAGVVHRDVKPGNVLLDRAGHAKLVDFGLARVRNDRTLTVTGEVLGTPRYMSPEQADGQKEIGPAADVWALGSILFEMVALRPPFDAEDNARLLLSIVMDEPARPSELRAGVPRDLDTVIMKCLEKEPTSRYANGRELAADLERFRAGEPVLARPVGPVVRLWRRARRWRAAIVVAAAAVLVAAVLLGLQAWDRAKERARFERREAAGERLDAIEDRANRARTAYFRYGGLPAPFRRELRACAVDALRAQEIDPEWSAPATAAGGYEHEAGRAREAKAAFRRALQLDALDARALQGLAEIHLEEAMAVLLIGQGGNVSSAGVAKATLAGARDLLERLRALGALDPAAAERAGMVADLTGELARRGQADVAKISALATSLEGSAEASERPGSSWILAAFANYHSAAPTLDQSAANMQAAQRCTRKAVALMPRHGFPRLMLAAFHAASGEDAAALAALAEVMELEPELALARYMRGMLRYNSFKRRIDASKEESEQLLKEYLRDFTAILEDLDAAFALDPEPMYLAGRAEVKYMTGFWYLGRGTLERALFEGAERDFTRFTESYPDSHEVWDNFGGTRYWAGVGIERHGPGDLKSRLPEIERLVAGSIEAFDRYDRMLGWSAKIEGYRLRSRILRIRCRINAGIAAPAEVRDETAAIVAAADHGIAWEVENYGGKVNNAILPAVRARAMVLAGDSEGALRWLEKFLGGKRHTEDTERALQPLLSELRGPR
jgi:predicted Ser/Thr protein kinase